MGKHDDFDYVTIFCHALLNYKIFGATWGSGGGGGRGGGLFTMTTHNYIYM
jgi:hypothetical protein